MLNFYEFDRMTLDFISQYSMGVDAVQIRSIFLTMIVLMFVRLLWWLVKKMWWRIQSLWKWMITPPPLSLECKKLIDIMQETTLIVDEKNKKFTDYPLPCNILIFEYFEIFIPFYDESLVKCFVRGNDVLKLLPDREQKILIAEAKKIIEKKSQELKQRKLSEMMRDLSIIKTVQFERSYR